MKKAVFFGIAFLIFSSTLSAADNLWVQSKKGKILIEPNFKSKVVLVVERGAKLDLLETGRGWYKVSAGSASGWINRLLVSGRPPMQKVTAIIAGEAEIDKMARRRASAITSAAASRGLSAADRKRLSDTSRADFHSLIKLENFSRSITDEEVEAFIMAGEK